MKAKERIPDVLASRYVSEKMKQNWSMHNKVLLKRDFWLAVMHAQKDLGISIPEEALKAAWTRPAGLPGMWLTGCATRSVFKKIQSENVLL